MTNKRAGSIVVYKIKENVLYHGEKKKMIVGQTTMMKLHSKAKQQPKKYTNTREEDQCNVEKVFYFISDISSLQYLFIDSAPQKRPLSFANICEYVINFSSCFIRLTILFHCQFFPKNISIFFSVLRMHQHI